MDNKNLRTEEVKANIKLSTDVHSFSSQSTTVTLKDGRLIVESFQNVFGPFRIYQLSLNIKDGALAKEYTLNGAAENDVKTLYLPPNGNIFEYYEDTSGTFTLLQNATQDNIKGTFNFEAHRVDNPNAAQADFTAGEVTIGASSKLSQGSLSGQVSIGNQPIAEFSATKNITATRSGPFLTVTAHNDNAGGTLFLAIPTHYLTTATHRIEINDTESENSVFAHFLLSVGYTATSGEIEFEYDQTTQSFKNGVFNFSGGGLSYTRGKLNISGEDL